MVKKILLGLLAVLISIPFILVYIGNVHPSPPTEAELSETQIKALSQFFHKEEIGLHHVFLTGSDFQRGQQAGYWTQDFLQQQEDSLVNKLSEVIPSKMTQYGLFLLSMGWFYGLDDYYEQPWLDEMYGVSLYGSKETLFFANPYTRQLAYHGIHDMGQMMIDQGLVMGACTQAAKTLPQGWMIGRNFDFEGGRVFDEDKLLKWVFPDQGHAFVSVIFSGMVGVITGINEHGVYIAINAAGSEDFTRLGTPTTLVTLKALQFSKTAKEAVEIVSQSNPLITDIYVIADRSKEMYVLEKSPEKHFVLSHTQDHVVTNHLQHEGWKNDQTNKKRMESNTTLARYARAQSLIKKVHSENDMVQLLRDKQRVNDQIAWAHRNSIDALIASHAIVYNSQDQKLYVSKGPSLSQEFLGIDLAQSFQQKRPVMIDTIPKDPDYQNKDFDAIKGQARALTKARKLADDDQCERAHEILQNTDADLFQNHYNYHWAKANWHHCLNQNNEALEHYRLSKQLIPAYAHEREALDEKIRSLQ